MSSNMVPKSLLNLFDIFIYQTVPSLILCGRIIQLDVNRISVFNVLLCSKEITWSLILTIKGFSEIFHGALINSCTLCTQCVIPDYRPRNLHSQVSCCPQFLHHSLLIPTIPVEHNIWSVLNILPHCSPVVRVCVPRLRNKLEQHKFVFYIVWDLF